MRGAGLLIIGANGKVLLLRRSEAVQNPGTWSIPGGAIEPDEEPIMAAMRESVEELGGVPPVNVTAWDENHGWTTFVAEMGREDTALWEPRLNWEHDDWGWFSRGRLPTPLHENVRRVVRKLPRMFNA